MVVWRRFGKEHGENQGFRVNSAEVVEAHIRAKLEQSITTPEGDWRWWQVSQGLIIERGRRVYPGVSEDRGLQEIIYYLPQRNLALMWRPGYVNTGREWDWYVHIGSTEFDGNYDCWVFCDLFVDVLVARDCTTHGVYDLGDLACALEIGLIDPRQMSSVLMATQSVVDDIRAGKFPLDEIVAQDRLVRELGWI